MNESILVTVRPAVDVAPECTDFDVKLIPIINSVFGILTQLGAGPEEGFFISGPEEKWTQFIADRKPLLEMVKSFVSIKTKLIFDPPTTASVLQSMEAMANEYEWRINAEAERKM